MQRFKKYMVHHPLFSKHERHFGQMILYSRQPWYASFASLSAVANRLSGCQDLSRLARKQGSHPAAKTSKLSSWSGHGLAGTLQTSVHFSHIITIHITITTLAWCGKKKQKAGQLLSGNGGLRRYTATSNTPSCSVLSNCRNAAVSCKLKRCVVSLSCPGCFGCRGQLDQTPGCANLTLQSIALKKWSFEGSNWHVEGSNTHYAYN